MGLRAFLESGISSFKIWTTPRHTKQASHPDFILSFLTFYYIFLDDYDQEFILEMGLEFTDWFPL